MSKTVRLRWEADLGAFGGRRSRQGFSYDAYVPDPIAGLELTLPAEVANVVGLAEQAVREVNLLPPALASLESLARQLLRAESVASSRIEGLTLSHRRLARAAFSSDRGDVTAQSVLANIRAMDEAIEISAQRRQLRVAELLRIHRVLFGAFDDPHAGKLRTEQNWVGGSASSPRDAEFVPPPPGEVRALLEDLCAFLARDDLSPVVQAAIAHAQFETIHPFADGNGRVGRCLIHVVLRRRDVAPRFVPPISLILATDARAYVGGLNDFRAGHVADWCGLFAAATRTAASQARRFADEVGQLQARWRQLAGEPRAHSTASALIDQLPSAPIVDVAAAQGLAGCSNQAARLAMLHLEGSGVVGRINVGRRNRAWEALGLFELLNRFEQQLATRPGGRTRLRPAPHGEPSDEPAPLKPSPRRRARRH